MTLRKHVDAENAIGSHRRMHGGAAIEADKQSWRAVGNTRDCRRREAGQGLPTVGRDDADRRRHARHTHKRIASKARLSLASPKRATAILQVLSSNACHVAIVEVDVETGHVRIEKVSGGGGCWPRSSTL